MCAVDEDTTRQIKNSGALFPYIDFISGAIYAESGIDAADPLGLGDRQTEGALLLLELVMNTHTALELQAFNSQDAINRLRRKERASAPEATWEYLSDMLGVMNSLALAQFAEGLLKLPEERREWLLDEAAALVRDLVMFRCD